MFKHATRWDPGEAVVGTDFVAVGSTGNVVPAPGDAVVGSGDTIDVRSVDDGGDIDRDLIRYLTAVAIGRYDGVGRGRSRRSHGGRTVGAAEPRGRCPGIIDPVHRFEGDAPFDQCTGFFLLNDGRLRIVDDVERPGTVGRAVVHVAPDTLGSPVAGKGRRRGGNAAEIDGGGFGKAGLGKVRTGTADVGHEFHKGAIGRDEEHVDVIDEQIFVQCKTNRFDHSRSHIEGNDAEHVDLILKFKTVGTGHATAVARKGDRRRNGNGQRGVERHGIRCTNFYHIGQIGFFDLVVIDVHVEGVARTGVALHVEGDEFDAFIHIIFEGNDVDQHGRVSGGNGHLSGDGGDVHADVERSEEFVVDDHVVFGRNG